MVRAAKRGTRDVDRQASQLLSALNLPLAALTALATLAFLLPGMTEAPKASSLLTGAMTGGFLLSEALNRRGRVGLASTCGAGCISEAVAGAGAVTGRGAISGCGPNTGSSSNGPDVTKPWVSTRPRPARRTPSPG